MTNTSLHQFPQDVTAQRVVEGRPVRLFAAAHASRGETFPEAYRRHLVPMGRQIDEQPRDRPASRMDRGSFFAWLKMVRRHGR